MKFLKFCLLVFSLFLVCSCGTINNRYHYFENAKDIDSDNIALLAYNESITVKSVNGEKVSWNRTIGDKVIYLPSGEYSLIVKYGVSSGSEWIYSDDVSLSVTLQGGKHYILSAFHFNDKVSFNVMESLSPVDTKSKFSLFGFE